MLLLMSNNLQHCESWRERLASRHPSVSSDQVEFEAAQKAEAAQKNGGFEGQTDRLESFHLTPCVTFKLIHLLCSYRGAQR